MRLMRSGSTAPLDSRLACLGVDSAAVCILTGVSMRQVDHWDHMDLVRPTILPATGSGSRRRYARDDIFLLHLARQLRLYNLSLDQVRRAIQAVRNCDVELVTPPTFLALSSDHAVYVGADPGNAMAIASRVGSAIVVNITLLAGQVMRMLAELAARNTVQSDGKHHTHATTNESPTPETPTAIRSSAAERTHAGVGARAATDHPSASHARSGSEHAVPNRVAKRTIRRRLSNSNRTPAASAWGEDW